MLRGASRFGQQLALQCKAGSHTAVMHGPTVPPVLLSSGRPTPGEDMYINLAQSLQRISLNGCDKTRPLKSAHCVSGKLQQREYQLPTVISNVASKKTILDPIAIHRKYDLPAHVTIVKEKVTPALQHSVPKKDPSVLQKAIDQGMPALKKEAARLVIIRHKKMKKHKLRKLRKRMYFVNKKMTDIKKKKKEKAMQLTEKQFQSYGDEFDAEKFVEERIQLAKKGGWGVNIFETRKHPQQ